MLKVYLAGAVRGSRGTWRDQIPDIPNACFMHPGAAIPGGNEERRTDLYGPADRVAVRQCDILLANCDRPEGGLGTAVEIGMALALGREVFLVCPKSSGMWLARFPARPAAQLLDRPQVFNVRYLKPLPKQCWSVLRLAPHDHAQPSSTESGSRFRPRVAERCGHPLP
jgi:hypothetical protein